MWSTISALSLPLSLSANSHSRTQLCSSEKYNSKFFHDDKKCPFGLTCFVNFVLEKNSSNYIPLGPTGKDKRNPNVAPDVSNPEVGHYEEWGVRTLVWINPSVAPHVTVTWGGGQLWGGPKCGPQENPPPSSWACVFSAPPRRGSRFSRQQIMQQRAFSVRCKIAFPKFTHGWPVNKHKRWDASDGVPQKKWFEVTEEASQTIWTEIAAPPPHLGKKMLVFYHAASQT